MHIWTNNPDGSRGSINLPISDYLVVMRDDYRLRLIAGKSWQKEIFGLMVHDGEIVVQLDPSDMARVAREYRQQVDAALSDLARLINSGAGLRSVQQKVEWIKRYWSVTDVELTKFLTEIETPIDFLRKACQPQVKPTLAEVLKFKVR